jgi:hypothetical protein
MLSVSNKPVMLSVVMLNVIILIVVVTAICLPSLDFFMRVGSWPCPQILDKGGTDLQ